jgi:hypothetical protein
MFADCEKTTPPHLLQWASVAGSCRQFRNLGPGGRGLWTYSQFHSTSGDGTVACARRQQFAQMQIPSSYAERLGAAQAPRSIMGFPFPEQLAPPLPLGFSLSLFCV